MNLFQEVHLESMPSTKFFAIGLDLSADQISLCRDWTLTSSAAWREIGSNKVARRDVSNCSCVKIG
jgi:hypothetical protein